MTSCKPTSSEQYPFFLTPPPVVGNVTSTIAQGSPATLAATCLRPSATATPRRRRASSRPPSSTPQPATQHSSTRRRTAKSDSRVAIPPPQAPPQEASTLSPGSPRKRPFQLKSPHPPAGDQPAAIASLTSLLRSGCPYVTLRGVTGSGKTLMMAHVIASQSRQALVLAPNKTLAAQLCSELSSLFPHNRVEFFVSHFAFFQPEAYLPTSDKYIAKMSSIDPRIDRLRHAATRSLFERTDTIVVASVSAIYGLGLPTEYLQAALRLQEGGPADVAEFAAHLKSIGYELSSSNKVVSMRGLFAFSDEYVLVSAPWEPEGTVYEIRINDDKISSLVVVRHKQEDLRETSNPSSSSSFSGSTEEEYHDEIVIYPARHFVLPKERLLAAIESIEAETAECVAHFKAAGKDAEATRLTERVAADIALLRDVGYCAGMENYSRHLTGRPAGSAPETLLNYLPGGGDWLLVIDESHVTVPQVGAMHAGNAARKAALVEHGFRLPSAVDNRPLSADEFWAVPKQTLFVSATPGAEELRRSTEGGADVVSVQRGSMDGNGSAIVNAIIRPTGIVDPSIEVVPTEGQIEHLTKAIARVVARDGKVVVTTVTKKFAEDLADCLAEREPVSGVLERGLKVTFLHSGIDSVGRMQVLEAMRGNVGRGRKDGKNVDNEQRRGCDGGSDGVTDLDVVVGVNLLREGIDLPGVELVAIMDADAQGFLRGETALIQTIGRAARNVRGHVIMYADIMTCAMERAIGETHRRRRMQMAYNREHGMRARPVGKDGGVKDGSSKGAKVQTSERGTDGNSFGLLERIRELSSRESCNSGWNSRTVGHRIDINGAQREGWQRGLEAKRTIGQLENVAEIRKRMLEAADELDFETAAILRDRLDELGEP